MSRYAATAPTATATTATASTAAASTAARMPTPSVATVLEPDRDRARQRDFVVDRLARAARGDAIALVALPAPLVPVAELLRLGGDTSADGVVWDPARSDLQTIDAASFAGVGACAAVRCRGAERFTALRREGSALLERVESSAFGDLAPLAPRLYGGLAFDVGAADESAWAAYGDCGFTVPRVHYRHDTHGAVLGLAVRPEEVADTEVREVWAERLLALCARLDITARREPLSVGVEPMAQAPRAVTDDDWLRRIDAIRAAIERGEVDKIVAARRALVELTQPLHPADVLDRLAGRTHSTRFAFRRGDTAFLGATPERLVAKRGLDVITEALAGSIESGGEHAHALLHSGKDRHEQQLVVDSIVRRLEPLCAHLDVSPLRVRELRDVSHLLTPIRGVLHAERHVLELAEALHPTPAVGGVPTHRAMDWIREREGVGRGWYAAPVGWFDARGDGELWVGLRSCLLRGRRALLYAGAGIVGDSDPVAELEETELKLHTLRGALEAVVPPVAADRNGAGVAEGGSVGG
ncbi:MAG: isochorismate synthase [Acidobacteriota bacterium]